MRACTTQHAQHSGPRIQLHRVSLSHSLSLSLSSYRGFRVIQPDASRESSLRKQTNLRDDKLVKLEKKKGGASSAKSCKLQERDQPDIFEKRKRGKEKKTRIVSRFPSSGGGRHLTSLGERNMVA